MGSLSFSELHIFRRLYGAAEPRGANPKMVEKLTRALLDRCRSGHAPITTEEMLTQEVEDETARYIRRARRASGPPYSLYARAVLYNEVGYVANQKGEARLTRLRIDGASKAELLKIAGRLGRNWVLAKFGEFQPPKDLPSTPDDMRRLLIWHESWKERHKKMPIATSLRLAWKELKEAP